MYANDQSNPGRSFSQQGRGSRQVKGVCLILKQFSALLIKRFHHSTRSGKDFLAQVRLTSLVWTVYAFGALNCLLSSISDCVACEFYSGFSDVHSDCSSVRRISQSDLESVDVRQTIHILQVLHLDTTGFS